MAVRPILLSATILAGLALGLSAIPLNAVSIASPTGSQPAGYLPQTPAQVPLAAVGVPKAILDPSGVKLSVVVNAFQSPPKNIEGSPPGGGRWTVLDLSVTNVGVQPFTVSAGNFQLVAPDTTVFQADGDSDLPVSQMPDTTLMPGDTFRGNVVYAVPGGAQLQLVAFQAPGTARWVVALLTS